MIAYYITFGCMWFWLIFAVVMTIAKVKKEAKLNETILTLNLELEKEQKLRMAEIAKRQEIEKRADFYFSLLDTIRIKQDDK